MCFFFQNPYRITRLSIGTLEVENVYFIMIRMRKTKRKKILASNYLNEKKEKESTPAIT